MQSTSTFSEPLSIPSAIDQYLYIMSLAFSLTTLSQLLPLRVKLQTTAVLASVAYVLTFKLINIYISSVPEFFIVGLTLCSLHLRRLNTSHLAGHVNLKRMHFSIISDEAVVRTPTDYLKC